MRNLDLCFGRSLQDEAAAELQCPSQDGAPFWCIGRRTGLFDGYALVCRHPKFHRTLAACASEVPRNPCYMSVKLWHWGPLMFAQRQQQSMESRVDTAARRLMALKAPKEPWIPIENTKSYKGCMKMVNQQLALQKFLLHPL